MDSNAVLPMVSSRLRRDPWLNEAKPSTNRSHYNMQFAFLLEFPAINVIVDAWWTGDGESTVEWIRTRERKLVFGSSMTTGS